MGLDPGSPGSHPGLQAALNRCATGPALLFLFFKGFYLFMRDAEREAQTEAEGEIDSMQGA